MRQVRSPYSQHYVEDVLLAHGGIAAALVALFEARFDPALDAAARDVKYDELAVQLVTMIDEVAGLDVDRILRSLLTLVQATLRPNHNFRDASGHPRPYLVLKFNPQAVPALPEPRPAFEIFVCSSRVEGVHLRFGRVARGGVRWSDRREDFRTEVLGLAKAQAVKKRRDRAGRSQGRFRGQATAHPDEWREPGPGGCRLAWTSSGTRRRARHARLKVSQDMTCHQQNPDAAGTSRPDRIEHGALRRTA